MAGLRRSPANIVDGNPCVHGHGTARYERFGGCVECVRRANLRRLARTPREAQLAAQRDWVEKNRDYSNERRREYSHRFPERDLLNASRRAAKEVGVPFNLTLQDIVFPEFCPVFGMALAKSNGSRAANSPSIDRIIPERGYVKGNIIIVSWRANRIKADASLAELETLTAFYRKLIKD